MPTPSLLFPLLFFLVVVQCCPNSCNAPHGSCSSGVCQCVENWTGEDCSIYEQYLNAGEIARSSVEKNEWKFYRHDVSSSGTTLVWTMNQTEPSSSQDGDLYIQFGDYPTLTSYLARDLSVRPEVSLAVTDVKQGTYYAGVFGYSSVQYAISVVETYTCPGNCFEHGDCDRGQCVCYPNFGGDSCEFEFQQLTPESSLIDEVPKDSWDYFSVEVAEAGSQLSFVVAELTLDDVTSDCDLYLAFERIPTLWDWDYSNVTIGQASSITLSKSDAGQYILGVYGYLECAFQISVTITSQRNSCPNRCSDHGTCIAGECECSPGFEGDSCDWMESPLFLDRPQSGYVGKNAWNFYHTRVITDSLLVISLNQTAAGGDCDLFVKADDKPSRFSFDYGDLSLEDSISLTISEPGDHTWFIGVFGWEACQYLIMLDEQLSCECGANNPHGDCREGHTECFCHDGWTGEDCSVARVSLTNGVKASSSVQSHHWKYFELPADQTTTGIVSVKEKSTSGLIWTFVSYTGTPTLSSYDLMEKEVSDLHEISISNSQPTGRNIFIGVYGSPYNTHSEEEVEFDLIAWGAPF